MTPDASTSPEQSRRIWIAAALAMTIPFLGASVYFNALGDHPAVRVFYLLTKLFMAAWPVYAVAVWFREPLPKPNFQSLRRPGAPLLGAVVGLLIGGLAFALMQTGIGDLVRENAGRVRQKTEDIGVADHYWAFACFVSLAHSLLEEYYWRWFVYGQLRRVCRRRASAHALAGFAFALHHIVITTQWFPFVWGLGFGLLVGVGGVIWSLLYERQRTLWGCWISHAIIDFALLAIGASLVLEGAG